MDIQQTLDSLKSEIGQIRDERKNKLSMVVFSGDLDKLLAAFIIATGAAAMGLEVVSFLPSGRRRPCRDKKKKGKGKGSLR